MDDRVILEELERRRLAQLAAKNVVADIMSELFSQQRDFVNDPSRNKAAICTRRAGKTAMWVRYALKTVLERPAGIVRIWAINRLRAKQLIWEDLKLLCARHSIRADYNETELTAKFENRSEIRLLGADKDKEAQKKRGDKTVLEVILESQSVGPFLRTLVEEVAEPCLLDQKGTFCMEGTPGMVQAGFWYHITGGDSISRRWHSAGMTVGNEPNVGRGWSCHHWSVLDNPHIPHARTEVERLKKARNWADDNPTYVREWLGRWVNDVGSLYYRFDPTRNTYDPNKVKPWGPGWSHTLGWDLGSRDDMALVVWGWHENDPTLYEAFSWKKPGALAREVMGQIEALEKKGFNFVKKVADTGGGGRMYVEDVMSRYSQQFDAAEKTKKYEHVLLFNDALLTGQVKLAEGSAYANEIVELARDPDWPPADDPEAKPREDPRCANHLSDAGLYCYRAAYHYLSKIPPPKVVRGTAAFVAKQEKELEEESGPEEGDWWDVVSHDGFEDFD